MRVFLIIIGVLLAFDAYAHPCESYTSYEGVVEGYVRVVDETCGEFKMQNAEFRMNSFVGDGGVVVVDETGAGPGPGSGPGTASHRDANSNSNSNSSFQNLPFTDDRSISNESGIVDRLLAASRDGGSGGSSEPSGASDPTTSSNTLASSTDTPDSASNKPEPSGYTEDGYPYYEVNGVRVVDETVEPDLSKVEDEDAGAGAGSDNQSDKESGNGEHGRTTTRSPQGSNGESGSSADSEDGDNAGLSNSVLGFLRGEDGDVSGEEGDVSGSGDGGDGGSGSGSGSGPDDEDDSEGEDSEQRTCPRYLTPLLCKAYLERFGGDGDGGSPLRLPSADSAGQAGSGEDDAENGDDDNGDGGPSLFDRILSRGDVSLDDQTPDLSDDNTSVGDQSPDLDGSSLFDDILSRGSDPDPDPDPSSGLFDDIVNRGENDTDRGISDTGQAILDRDLSTGSSGGSGRFDGECDNTDDNIDVGWIFGPIPNILCGELFQ